MPDPVASAELRRRISSARVARERSGESAAEACAGVWDDVAAGRFGPVPAGRGWFHEAISVPDKDAVFDRARRGLGITAGDLAAATRVYTPGAIVRFLLENTLGALWCAMHPSSPSRVRWTFLVVETVSTPRRSVSARDLTVLDPCCGAGAFLVPAAEFLADLIQEEEGTTGDPDRRGEALEHAIAHGVRGADIDAEAVDIARETLVGLVDHPVTTNIRVLPGPEGMLATDAFGDDRFDVVVTNPPYLGSRQMDRTLAARFNEITGGTVGDLAVAVQGRCWDLVGSGGRCGTITPAGWLNDRAAVSLRRRILDEGGPRVVVLLGQRVFDQAPLVFCSLNVLERGIPVDGWSLLVADGGGERALWDAIPSASRVDRAGLGALPVPPFAPRLPARLLARSGTVPTVGDHFTSFDGAWTGSHRRDVGAWWEVIGDDGWVPVSGGQGREAWAAGTSYRMRREHVDGQPDRTGLVEYPRVAGGWLCAREAEPGTASRAGVVTFVPRSDEGEERRDELLAVFNTRIGTAWLRTLVSGLNFNPGYASRVPLAPIPPDDELRDAVREIVALRREVARRDPTSEGFAGVPWPWDSDDLDDRIHVVRTRVERLTAAHLDITDHEWQGMDALRPARRSWTAVDDAWMVTALRHAGVRWPAHPDGPSWEVEPTPITDLADAAAGDASTAGGGSAECDAGRNWIVRRMGRYLETRFRRTAPIVVMGGVLRPREEASGR